MNESSQDIVSFFCQHITPLKFALQKEDKKVTFYITAFIMSVSDVWFLVTAGHLFKKINEAIGEGYAIVECRLIDFLGQEAKDQNSIPFIYDQNQVYYYYKEGEYDYGYIYLGAYYVRLLESNHVHPLNEKVWKLQPDSPISYSLLGLPTELSELGTNGDYLTPTLLRVEKVEERPINFCETDFPFFYGKIISTPDHPDLQGMSGGPIFAYQFDKDGILRYWLVGIQSAWLSESNYIKASPTYILGLYLEDRLSQQEK